MRFWRHILLTMFLVTGFALTAAAQPRPNDERKKPPKDSAQIKPQETKKPRNNEDRKDGRDERRGKKPEIFFILRDED